MAKYGSNSVTVNFDKADGTTVQDMTQYITDINGVDVEAVMEESHSFGDAWFESLATGLRKMSPIVLKGFYDDTATTGADAMFNAVATGPGVVTRTLQIIFGGTKSITVETIISKYTRTLSRGTLTKFEVTLTPTGAVSEA